MTFKFSCGLLLGAGLGVLITHYLNTREGRALADRIKNDAEDLGETLKAAGDNLADKFRSVMGKEEEPLMEESIVVVGLSTDPLTGRDQAR